LDFCICFAILSKPVGVGRLPNVGLCAYLAQNIEQNLFELSYIHKRNINSQGILFGAHKNKYSK
jgi:hypothetical protein